MRTRLTQAPGHGYIEPKGGPYVSCNPVPSQICVHALPDVGASWPLHRGGRPTRIPPGQNPQNDAVSGEDEAEPSGDVESQTRRRRNPQRTQKPQLKREKRRPLTPTEKPRGVEEEEGEETKDEAVDAERFKPSVREVLLCGVEKQTVLFFKIEGPIDLGLAPFIERVIEKRNLEKMWWPS